MKFTDIMLDIETFGVGTHAAIVQIGAVAFNADGDNPTLNHTPESLEASGQGLRICVDLSRSRHPGVLNASTVEWWLKQSDEARSAVLGHQPEGQRGLAMSERMPLGEALETLSLWIAQVSYGRNSVRLWSNGPTFDEMIVRQAYERYGLDFHKVVSFRQSRCCRTMFDLAVSMGWRPKEAAEGRSEDITKHDGLGDAVFQARSLVSQRAWVIDRRRA